MKWLGNYLLFLAEAVTIVLIFVAACGALLNANRQLRAGPGQLRVRSLNRHYEQMTRTIEAATSEKPAVGLRIWSRTPRVREAPRQRVFVLDFAGDLRAGAVAGLRQEVTAILKSRRDGDEVVLRLESLGGAVASYGLAASQVARLKEAGIHITVCVDRVAASGGYMMACVANCILAVPFAVVGSIGVVAQLPNFHRLLKRHDIDFEQFYAGEYKRTVTLFGENSEADRAKLRDQVHEAYRLFRDFVARYRPALNIESVATGELGLVDDLRPSDDYLMEASREAGVYEVRHVAGRPRPWWWRQRGN